MYTSLTRRSTRQRRTPLASCDPTTPTVPTVTPNSIIYEIRRLNPNTQNDARYESVHVCDSATFDFHDKLGTERHNERIFYYDKPTFPKFCTQCEEGSLLLCDENETIRCSLIECTRQFHTGCLLRYHHLNNEGLQFLKDSFVFLL